MEYKKEDGEEEKKKKGMRCNWEQKSGSMDLTAQGDFALLESLQPLVGTHTYREA